MTPGTVQQYTMSRTTLDGQGSRRMDGTPGTVQVVLGQTDRYTIPANGTLIGHVRDNLD